MIDYKQPQPWDINWNRPYHNYEKHHQIFWSKIRAKSSGKILDIACGSASCWKGTNFDLYGVDFSKIAIREAKKNYPQGNFIVWRVPTNYYDGMGFDTIVLSGLVNYYYDLRLLLLMVKKAAKKGSKVLITINVIKDFPDREWTLERIKTEFSILGKVNAEFTEKIGWFVDVDIY